MEYSVRRLLAERLGSGDDDEWGRRSRMRCWERREGQIPSLDVAQKYTLLARWYILAGTSAL